MFYLVLFSFYELLVFPSESAPICVEAIVLVINGRVSYVTNLHCSCLGTAQQCHPFFSFPSIKNTSLIQCHCEYKHIRIDVSTIVK